jgi:hypothetical protein
MLRLKVHLSVFSGYVKQSGLRVLLYLMALLVLCMELLVLTRMMPVPYKWAISMLPY